MEHYFDKHHCDNHRYEGEIEKLLHDYFHEHHDFHCEDFVEKLKNILNNVSWSSIKGDPNNQPELRLKLDEARNGAHWGNIEGCIKNQRDLIDYINCKQSNWEQIKVGDPSKNVMLNEYVINMIMSEFEKDWVKDYVKSVIDEYLTTPGVMENLIDEWVKSEDIKSYFKNLILTVLKEDDSKDIINAIDRNPNLTNKTCDCTKTN